LEEVTDHSVNHIKPSEDNEKKSNTTEAELIPCSLCKRMIEFQRYNIHLHECPDQDKSSAISKSTRIESGITPKITKFFKQEEISSNGKGRRMSRRKPTIPWQKINKTLYREWPNRKPPVNLAEIRAYLELDSSKFWCKPLVTATSPYRIHDEKIAAEVEEGISGLLVILEKNLRKKKYPEYYLCDSLEYYQSLPEFKGWACGFRNVQMQVSALMKHQLYRGALFDGLGKVPSVLKIQKHIDDAHAKGYDLVGLSDLGVLTGSRTWIGTIDACALLRQSGVPAQMFTFSKPSNGHHTAMFRWIWHYFRQKKGPSKLFSSSTGQPSFVPPLYFQHQGHSRTIVGVLRNSKNEVQILVFDPDFRFRSLKSKLGSGYIPYRHLGWITKNSFEIIAIDRYGLLQNEDRVSYSAKNIQSVHIPPDPF